MAHTQNVDSSIEVIFSAQEIASRIDELAQTIANKQFDNLLIAPILTGSFIFAADLIRAFHKVNLSPEIDFLSLASYHGGTQSTGKVDVLRDLKAPVQNREILIIDDILESGRTLSFAKQYFTERGAQQVLTCVLLNKTEKRAIDFEPDFCAFECPDVFVVGYGMDLDYKLRELPFIGRIMSE